MAEMMSTRETDSRILAVLILPLFSHPMFGYAAEARWGAQNLIIKWEVRNCPTTKSTG